MANLWRIEEPLGDNNPGFQNCCENVLKVPARACNTHVSAIPANNNGTFKKHFKSQDVYKRFNELALRLKDCSYDSYEDAGDKFMSSCRIACHWLAKLHDEEVADLFSQWWCGARQRALAAWQWWARTRAQQPRHGGQLVV